MKHSIQFLLVLVLFGSLLAACAAPTPIAAPSLTEPPATEAPPAMSTPAPTEPLEMEKITVIDALGREVILDQPPSRIMVVGKAAFMLLDAAFLFPEAPEKIIG
ncbi:MAG: hypothetical protein KBA59_02535, partial [Anaerolineaceae bacterium]|nr:hypothetical protein [Anaerolineaceae bacterium]